MLSPAKLLSTGADGAAARIEPAVSKESVEATLITGHPYALDRMQTVQLVPGLRQGAA